MNYRGLMKPGATTVGFLVGVAVSCVSISMPANASVFGALSNFDVVNDTGKDAYGFEIEIEDSSFDHSKITSVFGLNRVFSSVSLDPTAVNRFGAYGAPTVTDTATGVKITYGGTIGSVSTPSAPYTTSGDSCWPGANPNWQVTSCDHFGVSTIGSPAKTTYRWLVESSPGSGNLIAQPVGIPSVGFSYMPPPAAGQQGVVHAVIEAEPAEVAARWGEAYWVKMYSTKVDHQIDLGDLLRGDADQEAAEIEIEWSLFQAAPAGDDGANDMLEADLMVGDGDEAVMRRYEFYKYLGPVNPEDGEAQCDNPDNCVGGVGDYIGAQMAGFNMNAVANVNPVPQAASLCLFGLGLAGLGLTQRQRRTA